MPDRVPGHVLDCRAGHRTGRVPVRMPGHMPDYMPGRVLDCRTGHRTERVPVRMPDYMPVRMPGHVLIAGLVTGLDTCLVAELVEATFPVDE